jgi:hypothetical protein
MPDNRLRLALTVSKFGYHNGLPLSKHYLNKAISNQWREASYDPLPITNRFLLSTVYTFRKR